MSLLDLLAGRPCPLCGERHRNLDAHLYTDHGDQR